MTPEQTRCVMTQIVMPMHTNGMAGVMFGGIMMQWIDVCAGVAAMRHAAGRCVDRVDRPARLPVARAGRRDRRAAGPGQLHRRRPRWRSAAGSRPRTCARGTRRYVTKAYLTFVAVDDNGRPRPIEPLELVTEEDARRHADAERRRKERLARRRESSHEASIAIAAGAGCASPAAIACGSSRA